MARRSQIRSRSLFDSRYGKSKPTDIAHLEELVHSMYKKVWTDAQDDLEDLATDIQYNAEELVPVYHGTDPNIVQGALKDSINVHVSRSNRFVGIIAEASAKSKHKPGPGGHAGYDYALIQDQTEEDDEPVGYSHEEGMAHYLSGSFAYCLKEWFKDMTGKRLKLSPELEHAAEYVEEFIDL